MKKLLFAISFILLFSCVKQDDVKVNRFVAFRPIDLSSAELVLNITNNSKQVLKVNSFKLVLEDNGKRFAEVVVSSPVEVAKRSSEDVVIPLRMRITDPFGALSSVQRIGAGNNSVTVSGEGVAKIGAISKTFKVPPTPVVQFLRQAGVDPQQFIKSLGI